MDYLNISFYVPPRSIHTHITYFNTQKPLYVHKNVVQNSIFVVLKTYFVMGVIIIGETLLTKNEVAAILHCSARYVS